MTLLRRPSVRATLPNLIVRQWRFQEDLACLVRHKVEMVITSVGILPPRPLKMSSSHSRISVTRTTFEVTSPISSRISATMRSANELAGLPDAAGPLEFLDPIRHRQCLTPLQLPTVPAHRDPDDPKRACPAVAGRLGQRAPLLVEVARDFPKRHRVKDAVGNIPSHLDTPVTPAGWTWGRLADEFKAHIAGMREDSSGRPIYPSAETQSDVRQIFGRKEVEKHETRLLASLDENWFEEVQQALHEEYGYDAYRKFRAYGQAALNWAAAFRRKESGLAGANGGCSRSGAADQGRDRKEGRARQGAGEEKGRLQG